MEDENKRINIDANAYSDGSNLYGKRPKPVHKKEKNIGIDTDSTIYNNIVNSGVSSHIDIQKIESFTQISNQRELIMEIIDTMSEDPVIAAALEIYAEDATEPNDEGQSMWCVSDNPNIQSYITFLLKTMNVNKNVYKWAYNLCKYGDVYLRLYRKSEYEDELFNKKKNLNEDVIFKTFKDSDGYSHYVEMVPNPSEMFELTKLGKSYAYIKTNIMAREKNTDFINNTFFKYKFRKNDVELYEATDFVHASLEDNSSRVPEEVELFIDDYDDIDDYKYKEKAKASYTYKVRRGQSLLYNTYKIWRMLSLLENAILLNRLTKSSIVRIFGVEVGEMPKEQVGPHLMGIKNLIEQKSAINVGDSMSEYTNPGAIENNIYIPTHGGQGAISTQTVGGDVNVSGLDDLEYFKNRYFSSLKIPKQYLGDTDDATGFNGGTSLTLVSSRYAKMVRRIQNTLIQAITDAINLFLIDAKLDSYINKFEIRMQKPSTQEEKDRREVAQNQISMIQDVVNMFEFESNASKMIITKAMMSQVITDATVLKVVQDEIDKLIEEEKPEKDTSEDSDFDSDMSFDDSSEDSDFGTSPFRDFDRGPSSEADSDLGDMSFEEPSSSLPSPEDLGTDFTDMSEV